jgi:formylglycine-generating enzyme required for sulfatase activity
MLEGEVKGLRERLGRQPQEMRERIDGTQDEEERALLRKLEDLARGTLQGEELRQVDATIYAGGEMLKDKEYGRARAAFEKAKAGIEGMLRRPQEEEARFRAQRLLGTAEELERNVTALYRDAGLKQDALFSKATEKLKAAQEKFRAGRFQDSLGVAKEAVTAWQEAKTRGEKLAVAAKGSTDALAAAKAAEARWKALKEAEALAEGDDIGAARKKLAEGEKALEGGDLVAAMEAFEEASRLFEGAIGEATKRLDARRDALASRERALQARAAWERIAATGQQPTDEVRTAQQAFSDAEGHFGRGRFAEAAFAYRVAELGFSKACEQFGGSVPEGWTLVEGSGPGEWAKRVADPRTGIVFILVQPGAFQMGSAGGRGDTDERPRHAVRITKRFYLAETETTVGQWKKFVEATSYKTEAERGDGGYTLAPGGAAWQRDPAASWKSPMPALQAVVDDRCPVTQVSWNDAVAFCRQFDYRLPTEAEWEYACRAGTAGDYWWGDGEALGKGKGNFGDAAAKGKFAAWTGFSFHDGQVFLAPVKSFDVNPWGFADMLGNVWEWCADGYDRRFYAQGVEEDPMQSDGIYRVLRGGAWCAGPGISRSATRNANGPSLRFDFAGFRPAKEIE